MKHQTGDLVKFDRLRGRGHLRLRPDDLGLIMESIPASEAWEDCQPDDPNRYVIFWLKHKEQTLVYEDEILTCDTGHTETQPQA
jgi:hypothetical protein